MDVQQNINIEVDDSVKPDESDELQMGSMVQQSTASRASTSNFEPCFRNMVHDTDEEDHDYHDHEEQNTTPPKKRNKVYKQRFRVVWYDMFKWVENKNDMAHCRICKKNISGGVIHLKRHESSFLHYSRVKAAQSTPLLTNFTTTPSAPPCTMSDHIKRAEYKMIMFLAEHNLPFLIMDHLPKFMASVGCDSQILKNLKCARTKSTMILKCFETHFMKSLKNIINGQKYSIIADEATDISTKKCLALIIRFADSKANEVKDHFLDLVEVEQCTADVISDKIVQTLQKYNLNILDLAGFAADNASVMSGNISGVQARLRQQVNENIFVVGCICHSMALCASAAASKLPKQVEDFTRDLYAYFSHSSKRMSELKNFQVLINLKPKKLLRPSQTRWLSLEQVVNRVLELWSSLIPFFTLAVVEDNLQAAATLLNALNNPIYKMYFLFLSYILPLVNQINLEFQSAKPKLFTFNYKVYSLFKNITKNYMNKVYIDSCNTMENIDPSNEAEFLELGKIYVGAKCQIYTDTIALSGNELKAFRQRCLQYYIELCIQIKNRFSKFTENYKSFEILNPRLVVSGTQNITPLLQQFHFLTTFENIENIANEFRMIGDLPRETIEKLGSLDFEQFWFKIINMANELNEKMFPNLSAFISNILCFPHSSAAVERIFSQMNLIKSKTRNSLSVETCSSLLHCKALLENENCVTWTPTFSLLKTHVKY